MGFIPSRRSSRRPWRLVVRSLGYTDLVQTINPTNENQRFDVALTEESESTETVTITADRNVGPATRQISTITLDTDYLERLPMLGGESDILRTLQLMPGVQQATEISSGLYVRGGSPDQNLTLLDEVVIYNPSHLGGFLSTFNSDAIKDVRLLKGAFPAQYGGRIASVLDLTMREGTRKGIAGSGGISLISSRLTVEGPISDRSTFMLSGRRFYADIIKNLVAGNDSEIPDYFFYDLNGKTNYSLSESDKLYLSTYHGRDVLSYTDNADELDIGWGNTTANLRWAHIFSPSLFANFSLSYSGYDFSADISERNGSFDNNEEAPWSHFLAESGINDIRIRGEGQYFPDEHHIVRFGIDAVRHSFSTRLIDTVLAPDRDISSLPASVGRSTSEAIEGAIYAQDEWQTTDKLAMNIGARLSWFQEGSYIFGEPRFAATYSLTNALQLTGAIALAHQPLHLVSRNDIALPTDTWFPASDNIKPGKAWQGSLGLQGSLGNGEFGYSVEAYYKDMKHLYEYSDTAGFTVFVNPEEQLTEGTGRAYGLEFFLEKKIGRLTGWIGYTLAKTERTFPELNNGKPFSPRYDRRHDASIVLTYKLGESWEMGVTWVYGTGQAFTVPTGKYYHVPVEEDIFSSDYSYHSTSYRYTSRNAFRLPSYHRMDVNFSHTFDWFSLPFRLSLNVYNLYNRKNVFFWSIDEYDPQTGELNPTIKQYSLFPVLPTFGLSFTF